MGLKFRKINRFLTLEFKLLAPGIIFFSLTLFYPFAVKAEEGEIKWKYNIEIFASPGNERDLTGFEVLYPAWQNNSALSYAAFRANRSNEDTTEISLGLGYRKLYSDKLLGINLFYDTRTTSVDNRFNQLTVGAEYLGNIWDYRFNIYTPASDEEELGSNEPADQYFGRRIFINGLREEVMDGFDIEVGRLIPLTGWESRLFLAVYLLSGDNDEEAKGGRLTFETRPQKNVSLSVGVQNDSLFDFQVRGELRYSFAYSHKKEARHLYERMIEVVRRDMD